MTTGTFWDTVVIGALTDIALVSSVIANNDISFKDGANITKLAFDKIPYVGNLILTFCLQYGLDRK